MQLFSLCKSSTVKMPRSPRYIALGDCGAQRLNHAMVFIYIVVFCSFNYRAIISENTWNDNFGVNYSIFFFNNRGRVGYSGKWRQFFDVFFLITKLRNLLLSV